MLPFWCYYVHVQMGGARGRTQITLEGLHMQSGLALALVSLGAWLEGRATLLSFVALPRPREDKMMGAVWMVQLFI